MITALWLAIGAFAALFVSSVLLFLIVGGIVRAQAAWNDLPVSPTPGTTADPLAVPA